MFPFENNKLYWIDLKNGNHTVDHNQLHHLYHFKSCTNIELEGALEPEGKYSRRKVFISTRTTLLIS